jgi:subtilase family serine protease
LGEGRSGPRFCGHRASIESYIYALEVVSCYGGESRKLKEKSESGRKIFGMLLVFITVTSVLTGFVPVLADDPLGEDGIPIPSAMTLTADPEWIYINGDESFIIATVYDQENYTVPIPNMVVYFETDLGILRNVSYGGSITATKCWATTNESGVAIAAVMPVIGSAAGNATVKAVTGKGDVWQDVTVEFVKAEWRVVLFPDAVSKATAVNEDVTYTIMVRNAGTADDTYDLSIPSNEADYAALNKSTVSLVANTSEFVTLTVRDSAIGSYNTTVRAASPHASWEVMLLTLVREYGVDLTVEGGDHAEKTVAPGVPATYLLTVENTGSDTDSYNLSIENVNGAAVAQLNRTSVLNLAAGAKADVQLTVSDPDVGAYLVNVTATSQGHPGVSDTITTLTTVQIPLESDLIITDIALNGGYLFGNQSNQLCATVKNNGTAAAGPFNVSFNIGVFYTEARVAAGLAPDATTVVCVTDPTLRNAGAMVTILVTADAGGEISESNETNNARSRVETVAGGQPDLTVIEITPNFGLLYANASNEICATVKNLGGADASAFNVSFVVDGFSDEVRIAGLMAGAETPVCVTDPTWRNAGAVVTITVTTDSGGEISESNETNNATSMVATATPGQPDLTIIEITPNFGLLYANASNEICATVKNLGGAAASGFNVSFVVDGFSDEVRIAGLVAGAETTVCVTDPTMRNAGEMVTITVTADCNLEISESNETNNARSRVETVEEIPEDTEPPAVTNPTAEPFVIPDDTDHMPLWGEVTDLSVTVTDQSEIASVTINLSAIGGSAVAAMARIGSSDVWNVSTNASAGTAGWNGSAYMPYLLQVNASDEYGHSNTSQSVQLIVMANGDVDGDGTASYSDAMYLYKWKAGHPGFTTIHETIADVDGDGTASYSDAMYLYKWKAGHPGFDLLH